MKHVMLSAVGILLAWLPTISYGQAPPLDIVIKDQRCQIFYDFLTDWDKKLLKFPPKASLTARFNARINQRLLTQPFGYETMQWKNTIEARWKDLPDDFGPQISLSLGAKLVLLSGFVDNLETLGAVNPNREGIWNVSLVGLYAVLSASQARALTRKWGIITGTEVQESVASFGTSVYPICKLPKAPPP